MVAPSRLIRSKQQRRRSRRRNRIFNLELLERRELLAADITGGVFNDLNGDGILDQGEDGLASWTVFLDGNQNGTLDAGEASTTTDADGSFIFRGVDAGSYRVAEVVRSGWSATSPVSGFVDVTVADGGEVNVPFLNEGSGGTGVITGNVWRDVNNDGIRDPEDTPLAGWTVFIDHSKDDVLDPDEPFELTDADGNYRFTGILGGGGTSALDYEISQVIPLGWEPININATAAVIEGQVTVMPDFVNWPDPEQLSGVSGRVYEDSNANGIQDAGESGIGGWKVFADLNLNNVADVGEPFGTTSTNGNYAIFGVETGNVRIAQEIPTSHNPTNPSSGYQNVNISVGVTRTGVNFGNKLRTDGSIGGTIFADRDHNLVRDVGEEGLPGLTVYLDLDDDGVLDPEEPSRVTSEDLFYTPDVDEAGTYLFEELALGTYTVRHIVPDELSSTPISESSKTVTIGPGDDISDLNSADRYRPSEIHGVKFEDVNGDGSHDSDEPGIPGVTIFVDLNRNNVLDPDEPQTVTDADGFYSFTGLDAGAYIVREVIPDGWVQTFPDTRDGILWPEGVSNPAVGNVTPTLIETSLAQGETFTQTVSLTLPSTGALTNLVDVFLLFDDTGSFTANSPIVRAAFPNIISELQTRLPGIDLGFGVGRLEEYGNFAAEYATGRPFVLNQPVIASSAGGYSDAEVLASIQAALDRVAPGYGGDRPETVIEALYQMVTGAGFDGNNNGSSLDSGAAGLASTQVSPGTSGDVPPFASFIEDLANGVLAPSGNIGGAGFRSGALPIIITATDTGFAYQANGDTTITGIDGLTLSANQITQNGRGTTPYGSGAEIQETVTGLNALGALVIGLGVNDAPTQDPRIGLEALANLTGAINRTDTTIANGTPDAIAPGDPLYFKIGAGGDPLVFNIADGIVAAIEGAVTAVNVNVTLRASDPRVNIDFAPGVINGLGAGDTATFDVTFTGDGRPHRFDLQFVREGTDVVLGSIPVVLGTPVPGDGYEYEDCDDGVICLEANFGNQRDGTFSPNVAPSFTAGTNQSVLEDAGAQSVISWATNISPGPLTESTQVVDFIVTNDYNALFAVQPAISTDGTLTYTPADNASGTANVTVLLHDNGGTAGGGADTSAPQVFTIVVAPVNDAPVGAPSIVGIAEEDQTLTADVSGIADADGLGAFSYLWSNGATTPTITLGDADVGSNISVTVRYTDGGGTVESLASAAVGPVANVNDAPTGSVVIDGVAEKGQVLTANTNTIADADGLGAFSYLWSNGATTSAITLGDADVGTNVTVTVSYIDAHGTAESLTSAAVGPVVRVNQPPTGNVVISGIATEDQTLAADVSGIADADGLGTFSYLWSNGATTPTITLGDADVGSNISVIVSYTDGGGTVESLTSAAVGPVANVNDAPTGIPSISGIAQVGNTLNVITSDIRDTDGLGGFAYQWLRDGVLVAGASGGSYLLTTADVGAQVSVQVTYVDGHGTSEGPLESLPTNPVAEPVPDGTKFFIVDAGRRKIYEYDADGNAIENNRLNKEDTKPRGISSNSDGSLLWVVDQDGEVFVYDSHTNEVVGFWQFGEVDKPEGITVHDDDLWIVDRGEDRVYFFEGGSLLRTGNTTPTSSFPLDSANTNPKGVVTDGQSIWVVDDARKRDTVFRYDLSGVLEGRWDIDSANSRPNGMTIDPNDARHIWIVDARTDTVYQYDDAVSRTEGSQNASTEFQLARQNRSPSGIADPPVSSQADDSSQSGSSVIETTAQVRNNIRDPYDTNKDGLVSAIDALMIINHIGRRGASDVRDLPFDESLLDVSADGKVSPVDALRVINQLNREFVRTASIDQAITDLGSENEDPLDDELLGFLEVHRRQ